MRTADIIEHYDAYAHPLSLSVKRFDFDCAPPRHLAALYHDLFKASRPDEFPNAMLNVAAFLPREHGKSEAGTHVFPVWRVIDDPNVRILILMETEDQAKGKLDECRETLERLEPETGVEIVRGNQTELWVEREATFDVPTIKAAGFKSGITGGHYDVIIFDDPVSQESQFTEHRRDKMAGMFEDYLNLGSQAETVKLTLGTRKHPEDLYARQIIDNPAWKTRVLPAISDWSVVSERDYAQVTESGERVPGSEPLAPDQGLARVEPARNVPVLWPDHMPLAKLIFKYLEAAGDGTSAIWKRENQQDADAMVGQVFTEGMLHFEPALPKRAQDLTWYLGADVALEPDAEKAAKNDTDYWAVAAFGRDTATQTFYLDRVYRRRGITMQEGVDWIVGLVDQYPTSNVFVESNQAQRFVAQSARDQGVFAKEYSSTGNKEERIHSMSSRFENGNVRLVGDPTAEYWQTFASEWVQFPTGSHDDQLDACRIALDAWSEEQEERTKSAPSPFV